jgi:hypothetical protein
MNMRLEAPVSALAALRPACTIHAQSYSEHVLQIYAGLYALHAAGAIRVRHEYGSGPRGLNGLLVNIEGRKVFFDVRDSENYWADIAAEVDVYAKRSFRPGMPGKIIPLGLNYAVSLDRTTWPELARSLAQLERASLSWKRLAMALARMVPGASAAFGLPTVGSMSALPDPDAEPQVIFLARPWRPEDVGGRPEVVGPLNDMRAECIRALRREFGARFCGGFPRSAQALEEYPDCVVDAGVSTRRSDYLRRLRAYPICVATTGLYGSIGWKFAEYVALSKAIVSEPLQYGLPGPIAAGENFLEFRTPDECVAAVGALMRDREARLRMMQANRRYHLEYGTPQAIVGRVLHAALA